MNRREFLTTIAGAAVALPVVGCGNYSNDPISVQPGSTTVLVNGVEVTFVMTAPEKGLIIAHNTNGTGVEIKVTITPDGGTPINDSFLGSGNEKVSAPRPLTRGSIAKIEVYLWSNVADATACAFSRGSGCIRGPVSTEFYRFE